MTTGCTTSVAIVSGGTLTGLTQGTAYYVGVTATAPTGYVANTAVSSSSLIPTTQLSNPGTPTLAYGATAGSLTVTFSAPANAAAGQTYTAQACTNAAMTTGCTTSVAIVSGGTLTGLTQGTPYYVGVTATASTGYLVSGQAVSSSSLNPTTQLSNPGTPTLAYGTSAGSIAVTFSAPANAAAGQTYTLQACTNAGMSTGCVTYPSPVTSAGTFTFTGLPFTAGTAGTSYYVGVTANASTGYLVSGKSVSSSSHAETSQESTPTLTANTGSSTGKVALQISAATTPSGATYTCNAYTSVSLATLVATGACTTSGGNWNPSSGTLTSGTTYYFTAIATPSSGNSSAYVTSAVSATVSASAR